MANLEVLQQTSNSWLELGIAGAALFIVLILVVLMFRQQSNSIDKLCSKIDVLVTSFSDNNLKLNEAILSNSRDQAETLRKLDDLTDVVNDMHKRIVRMEAKTFNFKKEGDGQKS